MMDIRYNGKRQLVASEEKPDGTEVITFTNPETDDLAMFLLPRAREIEAANKAAVQQAINEAYFKNLL